MKIYIIALLTTLWALAFIGCNGSPGTTTSQQEPEGVFVDDIVDVYKTIVILPNTAEDEKQKIRNKMDEVKADVKKAYIAEFKDKCPESGAIGKLKSYATCKKETYVEARKTPVAEKKIEKMAHNKCQKLLKGVTNKCWAAFDASFGDYMQKVTAKINNP